MRHARCLCTRPCSLARQVRPPCCMMLLPRRHSSGGARAEKACVRSHEAWPCAHLLVGCTADQPPANAARARAAHAAAVPKLHAAGRPSRLPPRRTTKKSRTTMPENMSTAPASTREIPEEAGRQAGGRAGARQLIDTVRQGSCNGLLGLTYHVIPRQPEGAHPNASQRHISCGAHGLALAHHRT